MATSGAALPRAPFMVQHAPKNRYPLSRDLSEWAAPNKGSKSVSVPHKSPLHFFVLLEISAARSGGKNQQTLLTANGASYSSGTC